MSQIKLKINQVLLNKLEQNKKLLMLYTKYKIY